jgi:HEAT repeat protein
MRSLPHLGPDGQKALADLLSDKDEQVRKERFFMLCKPHFGFFLSEERAADFRPIVPQLISFLTDKDYYVRLVTLVNINRGSPTLPPELVKAALSLLDDIEFLKYLSKFYDAELAKVCGPAAIPKLLKYLKSDDKELRKLGVRELSVLRGHGTESLLPILREVAVGKTKHPEIAPVIAARMAIRISLDPKDVELLLPLLMSDDPKNRSSAAIEFRWLGHLARPHLKHLFPLLKDQDADVRRTAARTINFIDSSDPDVCAALARYLVDFGDRVGLEDTGPFATEIAPAVPALLKMLESEDKNEWRFGIYMVQRIGPLAKDAVPLLLPYLTQPNPEEVLRALGAIGPAAKDAVPVIREQLAKVEGREKMWYLLCHAGIGPAAIDAVANLKELFIDPNPELRLLAACALSKIEGDPASYRATLVRGIREETDWLFGPEPFVFDRVAVDCPELIPVVIRRGMRRSFGRDSGTVMRALKRNASAAKNAVPDLVNYLNKPPSRGMEPELIELLGAIGPDAKAALPKLRELRDGPDFELALAADESIQKIEAKK